jgi:hypothetical protein
MSVSVVILKSGDQILCNLRELFDGDSENRKGICLLMHHPYLLSIVEVPLQEKVGTDLQVKFTRWCPYSSDTEFKLPYDSVLSVATPDSSLAEAYEQKILAEFGEQISENKNIEESVPLSETEVV